MVQRNSSRSPASRDLDEMKQWSSKFDKKYRTTPPPCQSKDEGDRTHEHRASVRFGTSQEWEQATHHTSSSGSRAKVVKPPNKRGNSTPSPSPDDASIVSSWSKSIHVKPLFEGSSIPGLEHSHRAPSPNKLHDNDDPWRAAKRGDLAALKKFHASGKVDWLENDRANNTPLYYACHSGAIADIMVVPFLLWVTPSSDPKVLEHCRRDAINKQVRSILSAYKRGGLAAIEMGKMGGSVASSVGGKVGDIPGKTVSFDHRSRPPPISRRQPMVQKCEDAPGRPSSVSKDNNGEPKPKGSFAGKFFKRRNNETGASVSTFSTMSSVPKQREQTSHQQDSDSISFRGMEVMSGDMEPRTNAVSDFDGRPPRPRHQRLPTHAERGEYPHPSERRYPMVDQRDHFDDQEYRDDWDRPIEPHSRYGSLQHKGHMASFGQDDSWSIGSMLSLKKWRNNKKQLDGRKVDRILDNDTHGAHSSRDSYTPQAGRTTHSAHAGRVMVNGRALASSTNGPPDDYRIPRTPRNHGGPNGNNSRGPMRDMPKGYIEYHESERTWVIGNQWRMAGHGDDKMVHVNDPKQSVHVVNCHDVNVHVHGRKMKALLVDNCSNVNVIFDTVITTCEVVNCTSVGLQTTGLCPTFSIDLSDGVMIWLTRESMKNTDFVTSKSSNVTVSIPRGDDSEPWERKDIPLPVQYVHKFQEGGEIMSHRAGRY
eukprot:Nitzschia sp. Nitz4//scaffold299_size22801//10736//12924//NITZ4_008535-RA/size22801-augustus-gene-0.41-mRNA-1//1//CDS//3329546342//3528//frame0